jgi:hypothetical protein
MRNDFPALVEQDGRSKASRHRQHLAERIDRTLSIADPPG